MFILVSFIHFLINPFILGMCQHCSVKLELHEKCTNEQFRTIHAEDFSVSYFDFIVFRFISNN